MIFQCEIYSHGIKCMLRLRYRRDPADCRRDGSVANVHALLGVRDMVICTSFVLIMYLVRFVMVTHL